MKDLLKNEMFCHRCRKITLNNYERFCNKCLNELREINENKEVLK